MLNQNYNAWELIIIDDASSDNTEAEVKPFTNDPRIKYLKLSKNKGAAFARHFGIGLAQGEFIAFLDTDTEFKSGFLAKVNSYLENKPKIDIIWPGVEYQEYNDGEIIKSYSKIWNPIQMHQDLYYFLKELRIGTGLGVVVRKAKYFESGGFDTTFPAAEDTDLFFRLLPLCHFSVIEDILFLSKRFNTNRLSNDYKKQAKAYQYLLTKHKKLIGDNRFKSGRLFRKAAHYHRKAGEKLAYYKWLIKGLRMNPFSLKTIFSLLR